MAKSPEPEPKKKDAIWPFVMLFCLMIGETIGIAVNTDPLRFDNLVSVAIVLPILAGIVAYFAYGRLKGHALFDFGDRSALKNIAWHIFILTGVIFLSWFFFTALMAMMVLILRVPFFQTCTIIRERDVALFVWDAMASGAFKSLAKYLDLAEPGCVPDETVAATVVMQWTIKLFTSLVLVWYALSLAKAWYGRLRGTP